MSKVLQAARGGRVIPVLEGKMVLLVRGASKGNRVILDTLVVEEKLVLRVKRVILVLRAYKADKVILALRVKKGREVIPVFRVQLVLRD